MGNTVKICVVCLVEFILAKKMGVMSQLTGLADLLGWSGQCRFRGWLLAVFGLFHAEWRAGINP